MNREKQIEEMAKIIHPYCKAPCPNGGCIGCFSYRLSEALYNAGYRKASEVAREIFEEIEQATKNHGITYTQRKIAELKKKYTEGEE